MELKSVFTLLAIIFSAADVNSQWTCSNDQDCSSLSGSVCNYGACECRPGQQVVLGGSACVDISPYMESPCLEDHQCSRLFTGFQCRQTGNNTGVCFCQEDHHYFLGRCWKTIGFGESCIRSEECLGVIRDPYALTCNDTCQCSEGYYLKQRSECRKYSSGPDEGCVLDSDCRFPRGACNQRTFTCFEGNSTKTTQTELEEIDVSSKMADFVNKMAVQRVLCNATDPCQSPFVCSNFGVCICPIGYYESENGIICYAELGSPSTPAQCVGLLAEVIDGVCACRPNFFYDENMKDCIRVTRRISESCVNDFNCHTFGAAARCGPPQEPWALRSCECTPETSVWDENQQMCRYFAGVGEPCEVNSDCLAGSLEITCVINDEGAGFCACPEDLIEVDGLCLRSGLQLGEQCQHNLECTGVNNTVCTGVCSCADGYQALDGICAPIIGGSCELDSDCTIENTVCRNSTSGKSCQCSDGFVDYNDVCWLEVTEFNSTCNVTAQCVSALGPAGRCDGRCVCDSGHHYRDGSCWPVTGLFQSCRSSSQCFLENGSDKVVCRNSLCQCGFRYPYSHEEATCLSSKATSYSACAALMITLLSLLIR